MPHSHYWKIGEIKDGLAQGRCKCGAVKTFDAVGTPEFAAAASRINAEGLRRLGIQTKPGGSTRSKSKPITPAVITSSLHSNSNGMPPLPLFDKTWDIQVQLKWLEVWSLRKEAERR